jgi:hypothetical protein
VRNILDVVERRGVARDGEQAGGRAGDVADLHLRIARIGQPYAIGCEVVDVHLWVQRTDRGAPDAVRSPPHLDEVGIVPHFTGRIATAGHMHTMMAFPGQVLMEYNQAERPCRTCPNSWSAGTEKCGQTTCAS